MRYVYRWNRLGDTIPTVYDMSYGRVFFLYLISLPYHFTPRFYPWKRKEHDMTTTTYHTYSESARKVTFDRTRHGQKKTLFFPFPFVGDWGVTFSVGKKKVVFSREICIPLESARRYDSNGIWHVIRSGFFPVSHILTLSLYTKILSMKTKRTRYDPWHIIHILNRLEKLHSTVRDTVRKKHFFFPSPL